MNAPEAVDVLPSFTRSVEDPLRGRAGSSADVIAVAGSEQAVKGGPAPQVRASRTGRAGVGGRASYRGSQGPSHNAITSPVRKKCSSSSIPTS